ncbi:hypothetical protein FV228_15790 [Methylobacterium sp. WL18]|uniref:hypothetical protein n=1 Tax=Methylobacterium sp. WL18 TaxID=2603897 RepID=UPI0011CC6141|nr:hypothetical protein [Methylobacterium sp. WL18]TXN65368.1 hypothetical protein FV228_15790 [Methylobacterium sp. WL18]
MGRIKDNEIGANLARRLGAKEATQETAPEPAQAVPPPTERAKARARDGMHYLGFHVTEEQFERLRTVAFETRRQKQDLLRDGLEWILKQNGG